MKAKLLSLMLAMVIALSLSASALSGCSLSYYDYSKEGVSVEQIKGLSNSGVFG